MILTENRVPFGPIYVPEEEFENDESSLWFAAVQLRYYLARITIAPFNIEKTNDTTQKGWRDILNGYYANSIRLRRVILLRSYI